MDTDVLTATDETELLPSVGDHLEDRAAELCQLMIEKERLREEDLQRAQAYREQHGGNLLTLLVRLGLVSERDLARSQSELLDIPMLVEGEYPEEAPQIDAISVRYMKQRHIVPVRIDDSSIEVVMADPLDQFALRALGRATDRQVLPRVGVTSEIDNTIERYFGGGKSAMGQMAEHLGSEGEGGDVEDDGHLRALAPVAPSAPLAWPPFAVCCLAWASRPKSTPPANATWAVANRPWGRLPNTWAAKARAAMSRMSSICATWPPKRRSSASSTSFCSARSNRAPPTFISNRSKTASRCATASTAFCRKSKPRRRAQPPQSFRASRSWRGSTSPSGACPRTAASCTGWAARNSTCACPPCPPRTASRWSCVFSTVKPSCSILAAWVLPKTSRKTSSASWRCRTASFWSPGRPAQEKPPRCIPRCPSSTRPSARSSRLKTRWNTSLKASTRFRPSRP